MRRTILFAFLATVMMMMVGTGCTEKKPVSADSIVSDIDTTDTTGTDTLEAILAEEPMPKAADELFDDFFFNFAGNKKVQRERIDFPLQVISGGATSTIDDKHWSIEHFFMRDGMYTLVFNNTKQLELVKDTAVGSVYVERISFEKNQVRRWKFNRVLGLWKMQAMKVLSLKEHEDASFLNFYHKFSTDSLTQINSLAEQVTFTGPDPDDDFSTMTGEFLPEQWPMFAPWMPKGTIYNIHYGDQPYKPSDTRVFVIRGIANGMETELVFQKKGGKWILKKMNT